MKRDAATLPFDEVFTIETPASGFSIERYGDANFFGGMALAFVLHGDDDRAAKVARAAFRQAALFLGYRDEN